MMEQSELTILLKELVALPQESEWVEFKENNANPQRVGEYLSALSNSACIENKEYGYLVYGVQNDNHKIVGTSFKPRKEKIKGQELENWLVTDLSQVKNLFLLKIIIWGAFI